MTISITKISSNQWFKVLKVLFWVVLSSGLAALTAWLAKDKTWLVTMPAYNVVLVAITQLFQSEETQAETQVPAQDKSLLDVVQEKIAQEDGDTPSTPPLIPVG